MKPIHFAVVIAWTSVAACDRHAPTIRTDPDPILARVKLPAQVRNVVWTSEPVVKEGCIPAHDSPTRIHAFISGYSGAAGEATPGRIDVPRGVANELLPASLRAKGVVNGETVRFEGTTANKSELERPDKAQVHQAVVTPEGLVLELWVR
ncbi:MAG: hypothetical protein ABW133_10620 [Polyangiaceae bacterium]